MEKAKSLVSEALPEALPSTWYMFSQVARAARSSFALVTCCLVTLCLHLCLCYHFGPYHELRVFFTHLPSSADESRWVLWRAQLLRGASNNTAATTEP